MEWEEKKKQIISWLRGVKGLLSLNIRPESVECKKKFKEVVEKMNKLIKEIEEL